MTAPRVSVLVAAHDCAGTIGRAIRSALAQPEASEVIVVDDASRDDTRARAEAIARGEKRVRVIGLDANGGPAAARNRALDAATGEAVAILDSDDLLAPGRLARLLAEPGWDMAADNVVFLREADADGFDFAAVGGGADGFETIDAARFARGNLRDGPRTRGELGFLKPLLSRAFLARHGLRYDEGLRLGEDYDLYMRMLLAGARFRVTTRPGYGAVVRGGSLSARHATEDLARLEAAAGRHLDAAPAGPARAAMARVRAELRARRDHRRFLDVKAQAGLGAALRYGLAERGRLGPVLRAVAADKMRLRAQGGDPFGGARHRLLLAPPPG